VRDLTPDQIVRLESEAVVVLDQRRLPDEVTSLECRSADEVAEAIRTLAVRGAPAIGVAAAYGYALAAAHGEDLEAAAAALLASRPTAVNLPWAIAEMRAGDQDAATLAARAREIHEAEVERCHRMAEHGAGLIAPGSRALTHCNTGPLATGGYGTAGGVLRAAWERGRLSQVWVDETRPRLQGSRLTAWELRRAGIPFRVIADSAAGGLIARGMVDRVIVGADRIAANGDVANKVGTYPLAVLAARHGVPFYVAAPLSTIDPHTASGEEIPIEERDPEEVSADGDAFNPAFDVTPAELVTAVFTEAGVAQPPYGESIARVASG
jgi:methylthioribose-1-phosphate isomerase